MLLIENGRAGNPIKLQFLKPFSSQCHWLANSGGLKPTSPPPSSAVHEGSLLPLEDECFNHTISINTMSGSSQGRGQHVSCNTASLLTVFRRPYWALHTHWLTNWDHFYTSFKRSKDISPLTQ